MYHLYIQLQNIYQETYDVHNYFLSKILPITFRSFECIENI